MQALQALGGVCKAYRLFLGGRQRLQKHMAGPVGNTGWAHYLEQTTGVGGDHWLNAYLYLLIDEAQQSYWDVNRL